MLAVLTVAFLAGAGSAYANRSGASALDTETWFSDQVQFPVGETRAAVPVYAAPVHLSIPKLGIDASILSMGLTAAGNLDVPADITEAGWYSSGATPGSAGSAVIAGHLDGQHGEPGIFANLDTLAPGDQISVTDANGRVVSFVVRESKSYPFQERPPEVFTSSSGIHLNLITCTGAWDTGARSYAKRLVVFADSSPILQP